MATNPSDPYGFGLSERFNPATSAPLPSQTAPVDPLTAEIRRQRDRDLQLNIALSPGPDAVARATRVARDAGTAPGMVEGREDEVQRDLDARRLADLTNRYPAIGKWADSNPRAAITAQDDHKALGILGGAWDFIRNAPGRAAVAGTLRLNQGANGLWNTIEDAKNLLLTPIYTAMSEASRVYGLPMLDPGPMLEREAAERAQRYATASSMADNASKQFRGGNPITEGLLAGTESSVMTLAALATRDPRMAAAAMGALTGGRAYGDARQAVKNMPDALRYSLAQGIPEAAFEVAPASRLLTDLANKLPVGKVVGNYLAEELPNEMATQLFQSFSEWQTLHPEKSAAEWAAGLPGEMQQVALGVIGGGTVTAVTAQAVQHTADVAAKVADRYQAAQQAKNERATIDALGKAAEASKLRLRDPEGYNDAVRHSAEDAGVSHVYVPADAIRAYQQSDSYDGYSDPFHAYEDQIAEAEAHGGDVVLPAEFALGTLPGTQAWSAIKDDMRLSASGMSAREADTFESKMGEIVAEMSNQLAQHDRDTKAALSAQEKLIASIQQKLQDAGFTPYAARSQAELLGQRIATRAARLGQEVQGNEFDQTDVRQVLPPALAAARAADATDLVINAMRKGGEPHSGQGPSLLEWIAKRGGIEDRGGDIASMGGDKWHRGKVGRRKLLKAFDEAQGNMLGSSGANPNSIGNTLDAAISEGFFPDLLAQREAGAKIDDRVLTEAIGQELAGSPIHAREAAVDPMRAAAQELEQLLGQRGVNASDLTDDELRAEIARLDRESGGVGYDQATPVAKLSGREVIDPTGDAKTQRKAAAQWYANHLKGTSVHSDALGAEVEFAGSARKAINSSADLRKLALFAALPDLIARSPEIATRPDAKGRDNVKAWHYLSGAVDLGGERVMVTVSVREDNNGHFYYNHVLEEGAPELTDPAREAGGGTGAYEQDSASGDVINLVVRSLSDGPRGRILFPAAGYGTGPTTIELFQSRNLSTFLHETGHQWLEELRSDAESEGATEQVKADWRQVQDWFAAKGHPLTGGVIPTEAHEMWARGVERYLMEGKAPAPALQHIFDTLRGWLINIYKTVAALRSPITPEIREVMDRLIATDEQIAQAREAQALAPLFKDAAEAGMTGAEFAAYTDLTAGARGDAQAKLLEKTMAAIKRRETKAWNEAKAALAQEVKAEVNQRPLYRALDLAKESPLSQGWIAQEFGVDALGLLPKRVPPMYREGGVHPDAIAEAAGYGSGREMIEALIGAERQHRQAREGGDQRTMRARTIEDEVLAEMNRRHGDPFSDGTIEREALAAVNGELQGEVIAAEMRVLTRRSGKRATPYQVARAWARQRVRRGTYAVEASPAAIQRHARAVAKAGTEAEQAMLKQDVEAAFAAKQRQLLSSALLAEAKAANDEIEAARKRMDKIARRATSKTIAQDYLDQAHALLEQVDLRERSQRTLDRAGKFREWVESRTGEGFDIVVPDSFEQLLHVNENGKLAETVNWSRLPIETVLGLDQAVQQIVHLGRLKQTLLDNQERRAFDALVDEARAGGDNISGPPPAGLDEPGWWDSLKSRVLALDASLLKMETVFDWLDGGNPNGVFNRIVFRPVAEAQGREQDMLKDYMGRIKAQFEAVPAEQVARWADKVPTPFTDPFAGQPFRPSRKQLVAMALNIGNEGNLQRLADGYGWNPQAIENLVTSELTAEEWKFVQGVWDTIETLWPEIEALEKRINGVAPEKVEPREFTTPHGVMRGGYYPAIYDSRFDLVTEERRGRDTDLFESLYTRANTRSSATKARAEQVRRPILLDLGVINRHLGEVIHDVTHREAVMQAWKFLTDHRVAGLVDEKLGTEIRKQLRPWVKFVANSWAMERAGNEGFGRFLGKLRANATAVGLGLRATTMVTQIAGYSNSVEVIGEARMAEGIARFAANPAEAHRFVTERSGEMRHRMETLDRDLRAEIARITASNPASKALAHANDAKLFMFHGIGLMDMAVSIPTWLGAYNAALATGVSEADAAYAGDKAVRQSQGSGGPKDLAAISRGTGKYGEALKLLTMFYSYFSAQYQRLRTLARDAIGLDSRKPRSLPRLAARAWWLVVVPPLLVELLKMPLGSGGPDDDEWWAQWVMRKLLANSIGAIPLARDVFEPAWNAAVGNRYFAPALSPVQRALASPVEVFKDAGKVARGEETKQATRHILETAGYATGLVPGQLAAATQFLVDVGSGDADPQTLGDWIEGLSTGRIKD